MKPWSAAFPITANCTRTSRGQVAGGVEHLQPLLNARYDLFYKLTVQKHRFRI